MKRFTLLAVLLFLVVPAHAAQAGPAISANSTSIIGSGFTPGHEVIIFGAANVAQPYYSQLADYLQAVTVDAGGAFQWTPAEAISPHSIWFAVDLSSTEYAAAYPNASVAPAARIAAPIVRADKDLQNDALSTDEYTVRLLLVRANDAVWIGSPMRHGPADLNRGKPGALDVDLSQLKNVRGSKHLTGHLVPSDFVVMIDPISLRFYAGRAAAR
jgi:hypothetical protein